MAKREFTTNYNGEAIQPGEVMIPFEYTDLDAELCTNTECIKTVTVGGKKFKVIYKAVPEEWAKVGTSALNLVQNEALGHYTYEGSVSLDEQMDEHEFALASTESAEDSIIASQELDDALVVFVSLMKRLIEKSGKLGYAVLLTQSGVKGEEFYSKMKLTHNPANCVQQQAQRILQDGIANLNFGSIKGYKNKHEDEYKEEAYKLLDRIVGMYR